MHSLGRLGRLKAQLLETVRAMHSLGRVHGALMPDCLGIDTETGGLVVRGEGLQLRQAERRFLPPEGYEMTPEGDRYATGMLIDFFGHGRTPWNSARATDKGWSRFLRDPNWLRQRFEGCDADFDEVVGLLLSVA